MKAYLLSLIVSSCIVSMVSAQRPAFDSMRNLLSKQIDDTQRVNLLAEYSSLYGFTNPDTSLLIADQALDLARRIHYTNGEIRALNQRGEALHFQGNYADALKDQFEALAISRRIKNPAHEAGSLGLIAVVYINLGEPRQALQYLLPANKIYQDLSGSFPEFFALTNTGEAYDMLKMPDSALYFQRTAYEHFPEIARSHLKSLISRNIGILYAELKEYDSALKFYRQSSMYANLTNDKINLSANQRYTADLFDSLRQYDSSLIYARESFASANSVPAKFQVFEASNLLSRLFRKSGKLDSAIFYSDIRSAMNDSLFGPEKIRKLQLLMLDQQQREQSEREQQEAFRNRIKYIALTGALAVFLLIAFIQLRNNRQKQKANNILREQKSKIESTLSELRSTQAQLIQSEKMASLGELTAGIAHEIQNPLNFVNNFAELNTELIDEAENAIDDGKPVEAKALLSNLRENQVKINQHGQRADSIVKSMLQHSRSSSGQKEQSDINALANEYLRLCYQGHRAKDKDFNAKLLTSFDDSIGTIKIIPQEIGRVLLNLYDNAFYAVFERKKQGTPEYEPTVSVSTRKLDDKVEIIVKDNGNGIPAKALQKIFQPFFTTKPTGKGTGLGLSMSYDIIKAHGGEIKVESDSGEGAVFIILLPIV
ncbi:MAG: ATP-binding protein [Chitinophagales bacterium]